MLKYFTLGTLAFCVLTSAATAQEFSGGELGLEYNVLVDETSVDGSIYNAGVEFSFGREYAISVTAERNGFIGENDESNLTLHGLYHLNNEATVGLFYSQSGSEVDGYGIQGGTVFGIGEIGGYLGQRDYGDETVTVAGLESRTLLADQITFFTDFDIVGDNDVAGSTTELGISYLFDQGPEAYIQVGRASATDGDTTASETYIGIGARINFGADRGTTFGSR